MTGWKTVHDIDEHVRLSDAGPLGFDPAGGFEAAPHRAEPVSA